MTDNVLVTIGPVIGTLAAIVLDGTAMVPLGAAAGVVLVVWQMSARYTKVEDAIRANTAELCSQKEEMREIRKEFNEFKSNFPCPNHARNKER